MGCSNCKSQMKVPARVASPAASTVPAVSNAAGLTLMGSPGASVPSQPLEVLLQGLLVKHGRGLCADARRCESLIRDICGDKSKQAHLLIQALK